MLLRILYRRAVRLRRLTGNAKLRSQGEIEAQHMTARDLATATLIRPFVLGFCEPIVAFWNAYIALVYGKWSCTVAFRHTNTPSGILYCFIESFGVVFIEKHHFNLSENGLAFLVCPASYASCHDG